MDSVRRERWRERRTWRYWRTPTLLGLVFVMTLVTVSAARAQGSWFWYGTINFLSGFTCCTVIRSAGEPDE